jgi:hypothetical protein
VPIDIVQPEAAGSPRPQTLAESEIHGVSDLVGARLSSEAMAYCRLEGVVSALRLAIETARNCFQIVGIPDVELVHDPETEDASYLVIEVELRGEVKDIVMAHRKFAHETAKLLGPERSIITLNYNII